MSPLRRGGATVAAPSAETLREQAEALGAALESGGDQLDRAAVAEARRVVDKVHERSAIAGSHTVVALAGATGSGKSSLFNALAGADLAAIGARRPTTSAPTAAVWGEAAAGELLDWLRVSQRHSIAGGSGRAGPENGGSYAGGLDGSRAGGLDGLVLLDLPDFDSRERSHRTEAERVLALCDVFVWVTDPQKYADSRLHDDYVRALAGHAAVMVVVLNQADRLSPEALGRCRDDLARLFADDGVAGVTVLTTSTRTGAGVVELRQRLGNAVAGHQASRQRLAADLCARAVVLRRGVADSEVSLGQDADDRLVDALSRAAGLPVVLQAVEEDYRREATARSGWLFTRWGRHIRPDPLKRLRLGRSSSAGLTVDPSDVRAVLGRSSVPAPSPAARSAVRLAARELADRASEGLPVPWSEAVADAAEPDSARLDEALDRAVVGTPLRGRTPAWWRFMGVLQWVLGSAAVVGLLWLLVLAVVGWLQLPTIDTPRLGPLPWPTLLLVGGLLLGAVAAALARALGRAGARRHRRAVSRRLRDVIEGVASERLVAPVSAVLERHRRTRERLDAAARRP